MSGGGWWRIGAWRWSGAFRCNGICRTSAWRKWFKEGEAVHKGGVVIGVEWCIKVV